MENFIVEEGKIRYQRCSEVEDNLTHQTFQVGFSDYMVKMDFSMEDFIRRFFWSRRKWARAFLYCFLSG
jgi:hypothetical protein